MTGVEEHRETRRVGSPPDRVDEQPTDDWGPPPWRSPWSRVGDRVAAPIRPWVIWFGARRLLGGAVTIALAVGVGWWLVRPASPPTEARLPYTDNAAAAPTTVPATGAPPAESTPGPASSTPVVIVVHVAGAVAAPGIVELPGGSRVADALPPVGGARPDADLAAVNLATVLSDGQQVYVPTIGEERPPAVASPAAATSGPGGPIDLNRATAEELDGLPGVGPATAAAIVAHRDANGPFARVDELEAVRGIGPAKLEALRGLVTT